MEALSLIGNIWGELLPWALGFLLIFSVLARICPCNPEQPLWRKDSLTDIVYFFVMPIFNRIAEVLLLGLGMYFIFYGESQESIQHYMKDGYGPLSRLPLWVQAAAVFIISDFLLYWSHRWFHTTRMWRFHAIHHSPKHVDWLSTYRFHPINSWLCFTAVDAFTILIGFSPAAIATMAGFNMAYSAMVHANLNWTFGPLRYVLASPVFHRWHHTTEKEGIDKNFAPTFPILDIIFGTFYMPDGKRPERFGAYGSEIPNDFIGQLLWPFEKH